MTAGAWDASMGGLAIGALETFAMGTAGRPLGVTSAVEAAATTTARAIAPGATGVNEFLVARDEVPKLDWEAALVAGIPLGSFVASRVARASSRDDHDPPGAGDPRRAVPERWERRFGPSRPARYAAAFAGGALMIFGARLARGCTSGHGISGTMQLAASSAVFNATFGVTAVVVARVLLGPGDGRTP